MTSFSPQADWFDQQMFPLVDRTAVGLENLLKNIRCSSTSSGLQARLKETMDLDEVCGVRIPAAVQTRGNFKSSTVHTGFDRQDTLKNCFEKIWNDQSWDHVSIQEAHDQCAWLEDVNFRFFLFFHSLDIFLLHH